MGKWIGTGAEVGSHPSIGAASAPCAIDFPMKDGACERHPHATAAG